MTDHHKEKKVPKKILLPKNQEDPGKQHNRDEKSSHKQNFSQPQKSKTWEEEVEDAKNKDFDTDNSSKNVEKISFPDGPYQSKNMKKKGVLVSYNPHDYADDEWSRSTDTSQQNKDIELSSSFTNSSSKTPVSLMEGTGTPNPSSQTRRGGPQNETRFRKRKNPSPGLLHNTTTPEIVTKLPKKKTGQSEKAEEQRKSNHKKVYNLDKLQQSSGTMPTTYNVLIECKGSNYNIWRKLIFADEMPFTRLARIIVTSFGWLGLHSWSFHIQENFLLVPPSNQKHRKKDQTYADDVHLRDFKL